MTIFCLHTLIQPAVFAGFLFACGGIISAAPGPALDDAGSNDGSVGSGRSGTSIPNGAGGGSSTAGSGASGTADASNGSSDGVADAGPSYTLIDNMSGGSTRNGPVQCAGCNGSWYDYGDCTGILTPMPFLYMAFTPSLTTVFSSTAETNAARIASTKPFDFFAGMGFFYTLSAAEASVSQPMPLDVSAFTGISFYARADADGGATTLHVQFPDKNTDPHGNICTACFDHHETTVALTTTWTQYTVPFSGLSQVGFGAPQTAALDTHSAFGLVFQVNGPCFADGGTRCMLTPSCVFASADGGSLGTTVPFDVSVTALYFTK